MQQLNEIMKRAGDVHGHAGVVEASAHSSNGNDSAVPKGRKSGFDKRQFFKEKGKSTTTV